MIPEYYTTEEANEYRAIAADKTAGQHWLNEAYLKLETRVIARRAAALCEMTTPEGMTLECERGNYALGMPHTGELYYLAEEEITECLTAGSFAPVETKARAELA